MISSLITSRMKWLGQFDQALVVTMLMFKLDKLFTPTSNVHIVCVISTGLQLRGISLYVFQ